MGILPQDFGDIRSIQMPDGSRRSMLVAECSRCGQEAQIPATSASGSPMPIEFFQQKLRERGWNPADVICHRFATVRAEAAKACPSIRSVTYRDLRRTAGVNARAEGVSKDDVGDLLGNSAATNQRLADVYMTPGLVTASRAVLALRRPGKPAKKEKNEG